MNLTQRLKSAYSYFTSLNLTEHNRQLIYKTFGSFHANQFALSGNSLIENSYEKNVDVFAVIKKIVDILKSIPIIVEQQQRNGEWVEIKDTTLHELMNKPNVGKSYTWNDIEEQLFIYLLCSGNGYLYGTSQFNSYLIEEVDILPSNHVCIKSNSDFFTPDVKYLFELENKKYSFDKTNLCQIKFFNPSYETVNESLYGLSAIQVAAKVVQTGNDRWDADANLLQNRGAIGLITDKSQRPMLPEEALKVQQDFDSQVGGTRNFGKVKVTNKDLSYIQMAMSSVDLQLIEKGVVNLRAICNIFGLDSSLFNDPENKTYNNRKEAEKSMYTNAIMPLANKISEHYTMFLCANHFPQKEVRMRYDFSGIEVLQENFKEKAEVYTMLKNAGIISASDSAEALKVPSASEPNITIDTLRSISPLVSNQLVQSMTQTEIRNLLGLGSTTEPTIGSQQNQQFQQPKDEENI